MTDTNDDIEKFPYATCYGRLLARVDMVLSVMEFRYSSDEDRAEAIRELRDEKEGCEAHLDAYHTRQKKRHDKEKRQEKLARENHEPIMLKCDECGAEMEFWDWTECDGYQIRMYTHPESDFCMAPDEHNHVFVYNTVQADTEQKALNG